MPDIFTLLLLIACIMGAPFAWAHDRNLEPADTDNDTVDDYDTRRDEWAETQSIERQSHTRQ